MIAPDGITVIYAGQRYAVYQDGTSRIFNLIDSSAPSRVEYPLLVPATPPAIGWVASPSSSEWVMCPFGTPLGSDMESTITIRGLNMTSGACTLDLIAPPLAAPVALSTYTVHVVPIFTAAVAFSRGSANILIG
jgi:hypothetical protein